MFGLDTFGVVYFDQCLGAAHSKRWSKLSFSGFLLQKPKKSKKFAENFSKKQVFLSVHQNAGRLLNKRASPIMLMQYKQTILLFKPFNEIYKRAFSNNTKSLENKTT